jgi:hypothetical protein
MGSEVFARIYQYRPELRVHVALAAQQQNRGKPGNGHADFIRDLEPAAALEFLLIDKHLEEALEPVLLVWRKAAIAMHPLADDRFPWNWDWICHQLAPAPFSEPQHISYFSTTSLVKNESRGKTPLAPTPTL